MSDRRTLSRRQLLAATGGVIGAAAVGRTAHNTVVGYGQFGRGTNVVEQDENGDLTPRFRAEIPLEASVTYDFQFHSPEAFFETLDGAETNPEIVGELRRATATDPAVVESLLGVDPTDARAVVRGLEAAFRERTSYDVVQYFANSIDQNVSFGATELGERFDNPSELSTILEDGSRPVLCWDLVRGSIEAVHAAAPGEQTPPLAACYVHDRRHGHAYTGLVSAVEADSEEGSDGVSGAGFRIPVTVVDYTRVVQLEQFGLEWAADDPLSAYGRTHRVDAVYW
ncbi:MAG: hypothetical protein PPP58_12500 [Natronomonas sp.]